jgi:PleD family two-component response regulator
MGAGNLRQSREIGISGLDFCALQAGRSQTLAEPTLRRLVENLRHGEDWVMVPEPNSEPVPAHVLLVEDEVLIRSVIAETLRDAGLLVIEAANADEAWSYLQTGASVDLVFSDIQMPGSMDGIELARKVKEITITSLSF